MDPFVKTTRFSGMNPGLGAYPPYRSLADVVEIERVPLDERITRWDFALNLLDGCRIDPLRAALHVTDNGRLDGPVLSWRFDELEGRSLQVANLLRASGLGRDDVVAIVSPTMPALFALLIGGMLAARTFSINWMLDASSLRDLFEASGAKAVVALGPTPGFTIWENANAAINGMRMPPRLFSCHDPFEPPYADDLLVAAAVHSSKHLTFERAPAQGGDVACYAHSGGTTGHPKIVRILHRSMVYRQWAANMCLAFTPDDIVLSDTPLFHIGGLLVRGLVSTADGHTTVIPSLHGARDKNYMASYWRYVDRFQVTQVSGVPTSLAVLAKNPPTTENISSLRPYFATGSTAMAPAVQQRIQEVSGSRALQSYALTENTGHAAMDPRDGDSRRGCSGIRIPYTTIRIVKMGANSEILRECEVHENGMVLVGGPGVAGGYLDETQEQGAFLSDGYFVTGDLGSLDAEGYLRISGRQKDLIIRGGHNIEARLIEDALLQAPWVAQAAAVGKPDRHAGELPIAYVELHAGASVSEEDLLAFAAERIPERPAVPKEIIVLDKLPLTAVGKPIKHMLQLDAAKRVFEEALKDLPGKWRLELSHADGLKVALTLLDAQPALLEKAEEILSGYSTPYVIRIE